jgi:hypothetical protein
MNATITPADTSRLRIDREERGIAFEAELPARAREGPPLQLPIVSGDPVLLAYPVWRTYIHP